MDNNKISVVINTYNASLHLARVLDTVKDFDEIVICDMESTDNTLEIVERYGCKSLLSHEETIKSVNQQDKLPLILLPINGYWW